MAGGMNLASKYATKIDERFARASQAMLALNNDYKFTGVKTVNVYSIPVVPMTDYTRSGTNRYGEPDDLSRTVQTLTINRDLHHRPRRPRPEPDGDGRRQGPEPPAGRGGGA